MDLGVIIIFAMLGGLAWVALKPKKGPVRYCTRCGHSGETRRKTRGSTGIELIAWLLFIIPGVIYSIWRMSTRTNVCTSCGSEEVIPPDSPRARGA